MHRDHSFTFSGSGSRLGDGDLSAAVLWGRHVGTSSVRDEEAGWIEGRAEWEVVTMGAVAAPTGASEAAMVPGSGAK